MTTLGHIGKFEPSEESISVYLERVELFFAAIGIRDETEEGSSLPFSDRSKELRIAP